VVSMFRCCAWFLDRRVAVLCSALLLLGGCEPRSSPESVVTTFISAINDKDVNRMLDCVDPRQERLFRATFQIVERLTGIPVASLLDILPGLAQLLPPGQVDDFRFSDSRIVDKQVSGTDAHVTVSLDYVQISRGTSTRTRETVQFVLRNFDEAGWRIVGMRGVR
jgi:hypothetical protein